jgi:hypothetical protein
MLLALAAATKWVLMLAVPPLILLSILVMIRGRRKPVAAGWAVFLAVLLLCLLVQYTAYDRDEIHTLSARVADQGAAMVTTPGFLHILSNRMRIFYGAYGEGSAFQGLAVMKLLLLLLLSWSWIKAFRQHLFKPAQALSENLSEFLFLSMFSTLYFLWWYFMAMKPWYRIVMNADILLFLSLALLASRDRASGHRIRHRIVTAVLCLFAVAQGLIFFAGRDSDIPSRRFEARLREGLQQLPAAYTGFGYGWWQAPRWSFLADRTFQNLYLRSVLYPCFPEGMPSFIFFEDVNKAHEASLSEVQDRYALQDLFRYRGYRIARVTGLNTSNKDYVPEVDFAKEDFPESTAGFFDRQKNQPFLYAMPDAAVFLDNTGAKPFLAANLIVPRPLAGKTLKIAVTADVHTDVTLYDVVLQGGPFRFQCALPPAIRGPFVVYLLVEEGFRGKDQKKSYGVAVRRAFLTDEPFAFLTAPV